MFHRLCRIIAPKSPTAGRLGATSLHSQGRDAEAHAGERREHQVGERREDSAHEEHHGQRNPALEGRARVVEDVLGEGEAKTDHRRVDDPVEDAVELGARASGRSR